MPKDEALSCKRWIGWKAWPLLRIRYGSEDDVRSVANALPDKAFHLG